MASAGRSASAFCADEQPLPACQLVAWVMELNQSRIQLEPAFQFKGRTYYRARGAYLWFPTTGPLFRWRANTFHTSKPNFLNRTALRVLSQATARGREGEPAGQELPWKLPAAISRQRWLTS